MTSSTPAQVILPFQKSYKSALCIIPPPSSSYSPQIQSIRKKHDPHIKRWPDSHINLLYPFTPLPIVGNVKSAILSRLQKTLRGQKPFIVRLKQLDYFIHGKRSVTVWLKPESWPSEELERLERRLVDGYVLDDDNNNNNNNDVVVGGDEVSINDEEEKEQVGFQNFDDLIKLGGDHGFTPHLSLGRFRSEQEAKTAITQYKAFFSDAKQPIEFVVDHVCLITRSGFHDSFQVEEIIRFDES
ncbi:hypothetical protein G9A89_008723 [Geosiphon pyriformis]|nr:hypothetical protein G9A89_008723 [Geosiphon pyriformis]